MTDFPIGAFPEKEIWGRTSGLGGGGLGDFLPQHIFLPHHPQNEMIIWQKWLLGNSDFIAFFGIQPVPFEFGKKSQ